MKEKLLYFSIFGRIDVGIEGARLKGVEGHFPKLNDSVCRNTAAG